jgi:hypothetical protein
MGVVVLQLPARGAANHRRRQQERTAIRVVLVAIAVIAAVAPLPSDGVELWYSRGIYPHVQRLLTSLSNLVPFSVFDALCVAAIVGFVLLVYRSVRSAGWVRGLPRAAAGILTAAAALYLTFLASWGLNYRRQPLSEKLAFDPARATTTAVDELASRTIASLNRLYAPAHQAPASLAGLAEAFHATQASLAAPRIVPGRPKTATLLGGYFHNAAIAGMTDPFFLETLLAPDLLDVERPFVIAHEWAHLAGYADEAEANFVAWLTCMRGDATLQYSGWLGLFGHVAPRDRRLLESLDIGPRSDLYAMSYRYYGTSRILRLAARESYDKYLKGNRVAKGIHSYDQVVQLIIGTSFDEGWVPRFRAMR